MESSFRTGSVSARAFDPPFIAATQEPPPGFAAEDRSELGRVLGGDGLRSLYQPIVELDTGEVVGYEALARGPVGSQLERPDQLFAAARAAGRVSALDWACRVSAARGALAAGLQAPMRLFINMEPEAIGVPCPQRFQEVWREAERLDVVVEVTERALTDRPAELLGALESCRERGWSIALDDLGADSRSLVLLSLLRPDVVKLDLRLIQDRPDREIAEVVAAVNAYAERSGAVVLAEGIETHEHLRTARALGATHGQGWRFGRPEPLPEDLTSQGRAIRSLARPPSSAGDTPFQLVVDRVPVRRADKPLLVAMSLQLERQALRLGETGLLLATFQDARNFTPNTSERYAKLASRLGFVGGIGVGLEGEPAPGVRGATLRHDDALRNEWTIVVLAPHFAGALVALDLGYEGADGERRFDFAVTYDRDLVVSLAESLMRRAQPVS